MQSEGTGITRNWAGALLQLPFAGNDINLFYTNCAALLTFALNVDREHHEVRRRTDSEKVRTKR